MATTHRKSLALQDLKELGRRLEEAGHKLVEAARTTMSAAARDTRATMRAAAKDTRTTMAAAAEDVLLETEKRLRKVRMQMRKPAPPPHRKVRPGAAAHPPVVP